MDQLVNVLKQLKEGKFPAQIVKSLPKEPTNYLRSQLGLNINLMSDSKASMSSD